MIGHQHWLKGRGSTGLWPHALMLGTSAILVMMLGSHTSTTASQHLFKNDGKNVLFFIPAKIGDDGASFKMGGGANQTMTVEDVTAILRVAPSVLKAYASVYGKTAVKYGGRNLTVSISGVGDDYAVVRNHNIIQGRFFTAAESKESALVAVRGSSVARKLFGKDSPVGKRLQIKGKAFRVVGLFAAKGSLGSGYARPDDVVYVPTITAMNRLFGLKTVNDLTVQARSAAVLATAQDEVAFVLRHRHKIDKDAMNDWIAFSLDDLQKSMDEHQDLKVPSPVR